MKLCALDKNVTHVQVFRLCTAQGCNVLGWCAIYTVNISQVI